MRLIFKIAKTKASSLAEDDCGSALAVTLAVFLFLFLLCAGSYVVGETIQEKIELQNACDAAAYSAAAIQADGLSRMATVNKAMAWTYIQMTNRQMDYITAKWLKLSVDRFSQDKREAEKWTKITKDPLLVTNFTCDLYSSKKHRDRHDKYWWCGSSPDERDTIELNGTVYPMALVSSVAAQCEAMANILPMYIYKDMANIEYMNGLYEDIQKSMVGGSGDSDSSNSIPKAIQYTLAKNLARSQSSGNAAGDFGSAAGKVLDGCYFYYTAPYSDNPYPKPGNPAQSTYFLPLLNTEAHERIFLQMADSKGQNNGAAKKHYEFFGENLSSASGLDQWFIRGNIKEIGGEKHGWREENMYGIKRVYKSSNMNENEAGLMQGSGGAFARGNHLISIGLPSGGFDNTTSKSPKKPSKWSPKRPIWNSAKKGFDGFMNQASSLTSQASNFVSSVFKSFSGNISNFVDLAPSSQNPKVCDSAGGSSALYSQYEWGSAFWICACFSLLGMNFEYHMCVPKWYCGESADKFYEVFIKNFKTYHGYPSGSLRLDEFITHYVELAKMLAEAASGSHPAYSREDYESCEIVPNLVTKTPYAGEVPLKGCARIYGDDKEIYLEEFSPEIKAFLAGCSYSPNASDIYLTSMPVSVLNQRMSVSAKPWILSRSFFEGGVNGTGNGTILVGVAKKRNNPFSKIFSAVNGIFKAFDSSSEENYMVAVSAARAAYKHPADADASKNVYRVSYDDPTEELYSKPSGCVCQYAKDNHDSIKNAWNLSQTDWTAALLPVRYSTSAKIESQIPGSPGANKRWLNAQKMDPFADMERFQWYSLAGSLSPKSGEEIMNIKFPDKGEQLNLNKSKIIKYKVN